jgi:UDP-N-acetylmuramate dehydrogenase
VVRSAQELADAARKLWELEAPFRILGGGSNVLVSDRGVRGVVVLNQGKQLRFQEAEGQPRTWAESGASIGGIARLAAERGLSGLEWAASVPGTVGGAVVGNAGAHGGDVSGSLLTAELLVRSGATEARPAGRLGFGYRTSWIKEHPGEAVVLSATFGLQLSTPEQAKGRLAELVAHRQRTQPPGASMGSMFLNPAEDFAGRLIEAAGLKGFRIGSAEISSIHANFFVNLGGATAEDVYGLIVAARRAVRQKFGVDLDLEIEMIGDWQAGKGDPA